MRNLKKFRKIQGISQAKLATLCDTDLSYIGQIEMGKRFPSIKLIEKIAVVLDIEAYRFFMDESGMQYGDLNEDDDFLLKIPPKTRNRMIMRLNEALNDCVKQTLSP
ncbi:MAG: helix-turn-helix domain-containing protein [Treponema sp.]|nr:helix-turn-helix domain-containing protein [Treponema sp.]